MKQEEFLFSKYFSLTFFSSIHIIVHIEEIVEKTRKKCDK